MTDSPISRHARRSRLEWVLLIVVLLLIGGYFAYHLNRDHARIEARESERLSHQCTVVNMNLSEVDPEFETAV